VNQIELCPVLALNQVTIKTNDLIRKNCVCVVIIKTTFRFAAAHLQTQVENPHRFYVKAIEALRKP